MQTVLAFLKRSAVNQCLKFVGLFAGAMSGSYLSAQPLLATLLGVLGLTCTALTVSGLTAPDVQKSLMKAAALVCSALAGALQATQPTQAMLLLGMSTTLTAFTVSAPGTAAKIEAAVRASVPPQ